MARRLYKSILILVKSEIPMPFTGLAPEVMSPGKRCESRTSSRRQTMKRLFSFPGRSILPVLGAIVALPFAAQAQSIVGEVRAREGLRPLDGALITVLSATGERVAQSISNQEGLFRIPSLRSGTYAVTARRIGTRPTRVDSVVVGEQGPARLTILLDPIVVPLELVRVEGRSRCGRGIADDPVAARMVEELVTALRLTSASRSERIDAVVTSYIQHLDPVTGLVLADTTTTYRGSYTSPFVSVSAHTLAEGGFARSDRSGAMTYLAPDAEVLASDEFLESHCFRPVAHATDSALVGLELRPASRNRPDIEGMIWFQRTSAELQELDVQYVGVPALGATPARARVAFRKAAGGSWIASEWSIQTPIVVVIRNPNERIGRLRIQGEARDSLVGLRVQGGIVDLPGEESRVLGSLVGKIENAGRSVRSGTLRAAAVLGGTRRLAFVDSAGEFGFGGIVPGKYEVLISRPTDGARPAGFARALATIYRGSQEALDLELESGPQALGAACSAGKRSVDDQGGAVVVLVDTARGQVVDGLEFALERSRFTEARSNSFRIDGRQDQFKSDRNGAVVECAIERSSTLRLRPDLASRTASFVLGSVSGSTLEIYHVAADANRRTIFSDAATTAKATGALWGVVVAGTGGTLESLSPTVTDLKTGQTASLNPCGYFEFLDLPPGEHKLSYASRGSQATELTFRVEGGTTTTIRIEHAGSPPRVVFQEIPASQLQTPRSCGGR